MLSWVRPGIYDIIDSGASLAGTQHIIVCVCVCVVQA